MTKTDTESCFLCGEETSAEQLHEIANRIVCDNCYDISARSCVVCSAEGMSGVGEGRTADGAFYCSRACYHKNYIECSACERLTNREDVEEVSGDFLCQRCSEYFSLSNEPNFNFFTTESKEQFDSKGLSIGIELEVIAAPKTPRDIKKMKLSASEKTIITKRVDFKEDGSINSNLGVELATLPTTNDEVVKTVKAVVNMLNNNGFRVNNSCGYHLHLGEATDVGMSKKILTPINRHKIMVLYAIYKDTLFRILPQYRTGNHYCDNKKYKLQPEMFLVAAQQEPEKFAYQYVKERYSHINFMAWNEHNTLEIRCHNPTMDYDEIMNWIELNVTMFDFAAKASYDELLNLNGSFREFKRVVLAGNRKLNVYYTKRFREFKVNRRKTIKAQKVKNVIAKDSKKRINSRNNYLAEPSRSYSSWNYVYPKIKKTDFIESVIKVIG